MKVVAGRQPASPASPSTRDARATGPRSKCVRMRRKKTVSLTMVSGPTPSAARASSRAS